MPLPAFAQTTVLTQHNDIARTGANTNETILTPSNVNTNSFGKLFFFPVDGYVYAQPLYMSGVTMGAGTPQAGTTHNVIFIATEHDSVYAFDADNNVGANAQPLWQITLLDAAHGVPSGVSATTVPNGDVSTTDIVPEIGITSTGVVDPSTNTLYIVGKTKETSGTTVSYVQRLHALDVTTGLEKFGGPKALQAALAGFGSGSSSGILPWDPLWENNRAGLLLLNGIVYIAFAAHGDNGPWHGWILAYNASTLNQTGAWCSTPNGSGGGIWTGGAGLAADVPDPVGHPFGRILAVTGNGDFDAAPSYSSAMDYGDSIVTLDLTNGSPSVLDDFTPHDQANMEANDTDLASGGVLLLPDSVGGGNHILAQVGKTGRIYILNQDNLGGYNPNNTIDPEESAYLPNGLWGIPSYWNGNVYVWGVNDNLKVFPIASGALSSAYTSKSNEVANYYSPSPSISSNGTTNGIVWSLRTDNYTSNGREALYAHDATNVANLLYSSEQNVARDNPGNSVKFIVPTIANGKVYVGSESQVSVFGLLSGAPQAATPVISPASQSFNSSLQVTITDSSTGATIYYTTDGSQPTTASTVYSGPFTLTSSTTVNAMAAGPALLQSPAASATYTLASQGGGFINFSSGFTSGSMALVGNATLNGTALELTDGNPYEASAAWYNIAANVQSFTTDFSFQITPASPYTADGFTFTIQGNNASAIGPGGGGLGYGPDTPGNPPGIPNSVAIKFDLSDNAGEGSDSTGLYTNGQSPTMPAVDMTGTGIDLHSGDQFHAHMTYDGTNLTMTVTDVATNAAFTHAWPINIPQTVGGSTAYVGFTGGSGGLVATQQILRWTYTTGTTTQPTLTSISVSPANPSAAPGTTVQFHAPGTYSDNTTQDLTASVSWTSSNTSVATINTSGLATAVAAGTSTISAASGSISGSTTLTVTQATLKSIAVAPANPSATAGTTVQFHATGTYSDGSTKDLTSSVTWASSNTSVATINSSGSGSAVAAGTSTISAASGSVSGSTALSVTSATLNSIAVTPANPSAPAGTTVQFHATGTYSDGSTKDLTSSVTWASSNTSVATINSSGLGSAVAAGTSTISAASGSISGSTVLTVTSSSSGSINYSSGFSSTGLVLNGNAALNGASLRLTDGGQYEASSAWFASPVNVQTFTTDFSFQITPASPYTADGFTFTIQGNNASAIGPGGGGLGYGPDTPGNPPGIPNSVAIKFDLSDNAGEGSDSTGLYTNGQSPTMPAVDMTGTGIDLHSGDQFHVHMTYDGTNLTMTITDVATNAAFTHAWPINIPQTVGGSTAYVGFTGGSGGLVATQDILTWTY